MIVICIGYLVLPLVDVVVRRSFHPVHAKNANLPL